MDASSPEASPAAQLEAAVLTAAAHADAQTREIKALEVAVAGLAQQQQTPPPP